MDELIRELEEAQTAAERLAEGAPNDALRSMYRGMAAAHAEDIDLVRKAKRTMAEREPAWNLEA